MNTESYNPYYDPKALGLEMISFQESDAGYDFDIIAFWATDDGRIYTTSDSGCSCPTPFEDYEGTTECDVTQKLERIGSIEQAISTLRSWNKKSWSDDYKTDIIYAERQLCEWFDSRTASRQSA